MSAIDTTTTDLAAALNGVADTIARPKPSAIDRAIEDMEPVIADRHEAQVSKRVQHFLDHPGQMTKTIYGRGTAWPTDQPLVKVLTDCREVRRGLVEQAKFHWAFQGVDTVDRIIDLRATERALAIMLGGSK